MNYYERHIGDYARDAGHLTMLEHGAYTVLLDRYYSTEKPIPADQAHRICRAKSKEERAAVDAVLTEFFVLADGDWVNGRASREVVKAQTKIEAARSNGAKGGRPKSNPDATNKEPTGLLLGSIQLTQQKALQTPDTRHQEEKTARKRASTPVLVEAEALVEAGFADDTAAEFIAHKARVKAPLTTRAWADHLTEAKKAGWSPQHAAEKVMAKGWKGFEAKYVVNEPPRGAPGQNGGHYGRPDPGSTVAENPQVGATQRMLSDMADAARKATPPPVAILALRSRKSSESAA